MRACSRVPVVVVAIIMVALVICANTPSPRASETGAGGSPESWRDEVLNKVLGLPPAASTATSTFQAATAAGAVPDEVVVRLTASSAGADELGAALATTGAELHRSVEQLGIYLVKLPPGLDYQQFVDIIGSLPGITEVEPNLLRDYYAPPDDPGIASQWHLTNINAFNAWTIEDGDPSIVVADLDTGLDTTHEDFVTGVGSGRILPGYNVINGSTDVTDVNGHGTAVAGCVSVDTDNATGIAGVGWNCSFLPVKNGDTSLTLYDEIASIIYAADHGADVINMSFGSQEYSNLEQEAIDYAAQKGCVMVSARGNEGHDALDYPACLPNVIGVGSSDPSDRRSSFSDYGPGLDVLAPGENIYTTDNSPTPPYYSTWYGTSFSSPLVAGQAALLLSRYPTLTAAQVEYLVEKGTGKTPWGWSANDGYGLTDLYGSLTIANAYTDSHEPDSTIGQAFPAGSGAYQSYIGCGSDTDFYSFTPDQTGMVAAYLEGIPAGCDYDLFLHRVDQGGDWGAIIASSASGGNADEGFTAPVQAGTAYALEVRTASGFSPLPYTLSIALPEIARDWYFAEGYTGSGFDEWLCLQNPDDTDAVTVNAEYLFSDGSTTTRSYTVNPHSRRTIKVNGEVGEGRELSTKLSSSKPFIAERPMYFNYNGAWPGGDSQMGVTRPASTWYFAEGTTRSGFDEYLCLENPNGFQVRASVAFSGPGLSRTEGYDLPARSRTTIPVNAVIGAGFDVSLAVSTTDRNGDGLNDPVIAERPMYFLYGGAWRGGHISSGTSLASNVWYFAEGYTGEGFDEWLCLQNPDAGDLDVTVNYMMEGGATTAVHHVVPAGSRATVRVNDDVGPGVNVSIQATAAAPFIAERPMYFNYSGKWNGGHVVVGARYPSVSWYFAEGYTGPGFEEWLCLQNPSSSTAVVDIRYLLQDGTVLPRSVSLVPHSRSTIPVNQDVGPDKEVSIQITSDIPIVAERPIYFDYGGWAAGGSNVLGYTP
jgi:hypothetical protein